MLPPSWETENEVNLRTWQPLYKVEISGPAADLVLDCDETITLGRVSPVYVFVRMGEQRAEKVGKCPGYKVTKMTDEEAVAFDKVN